MMLITGSNIVDGVRKEFAFDGLTTINFEEHLGSIDSPELIAAGSTLSVDLDEWITQSPSVISRDSIK